MGTVLQSPHTTSSTSESYFVRCAEVNGRAFVAESGTLLFQAEKLASVPGEPVFIDARGRTRVTDTALWARLARCNGNEVQRILAESSTGRLRGRNPGAFIAEAGNFAAVTCWEPKFAPPVPEGDIGPDTRLMMPLSYSGRPWAEIASERPVFANFWESMEECKRTHLYPILWKHSRTAPKDYMTKPSCEHNQQVLELNRQGEQHDPKLLYWKLCMTSRDPAVQPPVPGAVREVIAPFLSRWTSIDNMPVMWLEACGSHARDVFQRFGFYVVGECTIGEDERGELVKTWFMMFKNSQS